jgi:putative ABC transport system substrate-binding protein
MKRREFITLIGGVIASPLLRPHAACAQQAAMPVVGFLGGGSSAVGENSLAAFRKGLSEQGFVENRNVTFEIRATEQVDPLLGLAAELVQRQVAVLITTGNANAALAAKAATATIPIVFANGADPVKIGLVASMNRPGGNVTGISYYTSALGGKRLGLLRELVPQANTIGFLTNPANPVSDTDTTDMQAAARSIGYQLVVFNASTSDEIDSAFASAATRRVGALLVDVDSFLAGRSNHLVTLAARYRIPASYANRESAEAGGLMSYADNRFESRRQAGIYAGRVLKGEKPADLPVLQPTKFELVINLKTAKALGLTIPPGMLAIADEVIE